MTVQARLFTSALFAAVLLAGCGGGGGAPNVGSSTGVSSGGGSGGSGGTTLPPDPIPDENATWAYWNSCANPRVGVDASGIAFPDRQGTLQDEMMFLHGWANRYYLWYNEIPTDFHMADFTKAVDYFAKLKTNALTASGNPKDKYHFTYATADWDAMNAGQNLGYGISWASNSSTAPRTWMAAVVEPGSPAAAAGVARGDTLLYVDGSDFVNGSDAATVAKLNAGLFPANVGESHVLQLRRRSDNTVYAVTVKAASVTVTPVKNVKVINTPAGNVGYMDFESHNNVSEKQLIDAITQLKAANVTDLVIDMRYNGGGLLYVASELAYMIAGPSTTTGKTFERLQYNDKTAAQAPIQFLSTAYGFTAPNPATAGAVLPYLGLKRVTVLTTKGTCSASESVINGLRGVDIQVNIIGATTCGKPYGFTPTPNCGTTYFSIEFMGVNNKGFGDYPDGLAPTCSVADDMSHAQGDPAEGLLAAALSYNQTASCPVSTSALGLTSAQAQATQALGLVRPEAANIKVLSPRLH